MKLLDRTRAGIGRLLGVDHGGDRYTLRRRAGPRAGQRQPGRRPLGAHDVRLLLGRLRDAPRRPRRPGGRRAGRPRPSGQPRPAVPEGPVRAPDDPRRRPPHHADASTAARRRGTTRSTASSTASSDLIDAHGPESVAVLSTGQLVTEEFYALGKLVRLGMGLRHYDGNTTLCMASAVSGYKLSFGSRRPARLLRGLRARRRRRAVGRQHRRQPPAARAAGARRRTSARSSSSTPGSRRRRWSPTSTCRCGPAATSPCSTASSRVLLDEGLVDLDGAARATSTGSTSSSPTSRRGPSSGRPRRAASTPTRSARRPGRSAAPSAACSRGRWASTTRCRAPRP